jgi:menaquinone-dependent protoporphyrinogen oxidase
LTGKKVLIVYGTRFGSTEGISEKMVEILKKNEINSDIYNLKEFSDKDLPPFNQYDGILIGTGIKIGQWTKETKKFISKRANDLNTFKGLIGFFVSSAYAAVPEQYEKIKVEYTKNAAAKLGLTKVDHFDAFGGLMDFSETSRMSWLDKKLLMMAAKQAGQKTDEVQEINDLRDWEQINKFTIEFIKKL